MTMMRMKVMGVRSIKVNKNTLKSNLLEIKIIKNKNPFKAIYL